MLFSGCSQVKPSPLVANVSETTTTTEVQQQHFDLDALCTPNQKELAERAQWQHFSLLERVLSLYALAPVEHPQIKQQLAWFTKHPSYIDRVLQRGSPYLYHIVERLDQRNMPGELAFLPIVESAFDPFAYSPGRASGMWQIIPGTGTMLGLKQTWWYDGRRDVVASTEAALDYLEDLHKRFGNDWLLALAAYNSGAGTVNKAIRKNRLANKPTDFWHLALPRETRSYVPRLLALVKLFESANQYSIALPPIENTPVFTEVAVNAQIDLAQAAQLAELSMDELYRFNPGFNRWATDPEGPHRLLIPIDKAESFRTRLAKIPESERITWKLHTIAEGETLSHIATRYQLTVKSLQDVNQMTSHRIRAGKTLLIPVAAKGSRYYSFSESQRLAKVQNAGGKNNRKRINYRVKSGDSFWSISRKYGVSTRSLAKWNNMAPRDTLRVAQELAIWVDQPSASAPAPVRNEDSVIRKLSYKVRRGDSLHKIADKFRVNINDIVRWNKISANKYLQPGQALVLFVDVKR